MNAKHRTGFSVNRITTIVLMRDPRVMGVVAGTLYGTLAQLGIDITETEARERARAIRDGLYEADIIDGERLRLEDI